MTIVLLSIVAIGFLTAAFFLEQARQWRRIANRPHHEFWGRFSREIALAAASGQARYAWCAIAVGVVGMLAIVAMERWS